MQERQDADTNRQSYISTNGTSTQAQSAAEAVGFLKQLRPPPWIVISIDPNSGDIITQTVRSVEDVGTFVSEHNGKQNLYYSVNPTKTAMDKKPAKVDIAAIEYLPADLDPLDGEKPESAKARYLDQLNGTFEPKPSAVVDSGNGVQALWRLDQAIDLSGYPLATDDKGKLVLGPEAANITADVEARAKALMERLGAKAGTQNVDRILRLPGTTNLPTAAKLKKGREPCITRMLRFNGTSYPLDAFVPGTPEDGGHHARQEYAEDEGEKPKEDKLARIIRLGENGEFEGDRSDAVYYVVAAAWLPGPCYRLHAARPRQQDFRTCV
jgi:hypothetical protein